jgi:hypothetical protein
VRLEFDINAAAARRAPLFRQAQAALDTQIVKDSNQFCPKVEGTLRDSGRVDGPGMISWNMPYARYQYYLNDMVTGRMDKAGIMGPTFIHYTTGGTMAKWFEHAKALYRAVWAGICQGFFK